jgi:hypothetical protein
MLQVLHPNISKVDRVLRICLCFFLLPHLRLGVSSSSSRRWLGIRCPLSLFWMLV